MIMAVAKKRHLAKAATWRIIATVVTVMTTFLITGSMTAGFAIGVADTAVKFCLYYFHERMWYKTRWGINDGNIGSVTTESE
jgi:uncharacterized membrane protein